MVTDRTHLVLMIISILLLNFLFSLIFYDTTVCEISCLQTCFEQLFCQPQANFSVTELTAHLTSSCLSHVEPMIWMQFELNKTVYKPFFTHTFSLLPSLLPCKENPPVHPTLFFPPLLPSKFRSFPFILSRCQGHPLSYLVSASFLPQVCVTSYISAQFAFLDLVMDIYQILLPRLCFLFVDVNFDFTPLLS